MNVDLEIRDAARSRVYIAEALFGGEARYRVKVTQMGQGYVFKGDEWEHVEEDFGAEVAALVSYSTTDALRVRVATRDAMTIIYPAGSWPTFLVTGKGQ